MTSPYTPTRRPVSSNPTSAHASAKLNPPAHNPYDQFTRPEFDAWIGDLTSRIRRVLAHEEDVAVPPAVVSRYADTSAFQDDDVVEDSFAEVKARRAAKGKARAVDVDESAEEAYVDSIIFVEGEVGDASEASNEDEEDEEDVDEEAEDADEGHDDNDDYDQYLSRDTQKESKEPDTIEISSDEEEDEPPDRAHEDEQDEDEGSADEEGSWDDHAAASHNVVDVEDLEEGEQSQEEDAEDGQFVVLPFERHS